MRPARPGRHEPYTGVNENVLVASSVFVRCRRESGDGQRARYRCAWGGLRREEQLGALAGPWGADASPQVVRTGVAAGPHTFERRANGPELIRI